MTTIFPIVEGHGERRAAPLLIRRIASEICGIHAAQVVEAYRVPKTRMLADQPVELQRAVHFGALMIRHGGGSGAVLVILDADDDCPVELASRLGSAIAREDVATAVVVANREYEAWFLAAAESLRGHRLVRDDCQTAQAPEIIRDAKGWLAGHVLAPGASYRSTIDQVALTARLDIVEARRARSFDKLCRTVCAIVHA